MKKTDDKPVEKPVKKQKRTVSLIFAQGHTIELTPKKFFTMFGEEYCIHERPLGSKRCGCSHVSTGFAVVHDKTFRFAFLATWWAKKYLKAKGEEAVKKALVIGRTHRNGLERQLKRDKRRVRSIVNKHEPAKDGAK